MDYSANINGISVNAHYSDKTVNELLIPLLKRLAVLHAEKQKRILVLLAAPPGAGKSTLVSFLEFLAKKTISETTLQSIGMDGFHRRQEYLLSHTVNANGKEIPMVEIKGAPVTFDLGALEKKIAEVKEGNLCRWPRYDRLQHNPVEDSQRAIHPIHQKEHNPRHILRHQHQPPQRKQDDKRNADAPHIPCKALRLPFRPEVKPTEHQHPYNRHHQIRRLNKT